MSDKEKQEISIVGRLLSMEMVLVLIGIFFLYSGIKTGAPMQLFWGGMILVLVIVLYFVRKKDWKKHWEEQEKMADAMKARQAAEKEEKDARK